MIQLVTYNELFPYCVHGHEVNGIDLWKATQVMSLFRLHREAFVFTNLLVYVFFHTMLIHAMVTNY